MIWQNYFQKIIIPNLAERTDRLQRIIGMLWQYGLQAVIWDATKHEDGRLGLVATMKSIFSECLNQGLEMVLILEDDCTILVSESEFHLTMDKCCEDLEKINWDCFYLGTQHPEIFTQWVTPNLLRVTKGFSTHAVAYSKRAMEFVLSSHIDQPIDNFLVSDFQKYNTSFCSYPILCSQVSGYSDICKNHIDWSCFIAPIFNKNVHDILDKRFKT